MTGDGSGNDDRCDCDDCSSGDGGDGDDDADQSRLDDVVAVLTHPVRRRVLTALDDADGALSVDDLATAVVQSDAVGDDVPGHVGPEDRVELRLYHVHLPKLAGADLVAFDAQALTASITAEGEKAVRRFL